MHGRTDGRTHARTHARTHSTHLLARGALFRAVGPTGGRVCLVAWRSINVSRHVYGQMHRHVLRPVHRHAYEQADVYVDICVHIDECIGTCMDSLDTSTNICVGMDTCVGLCTGICTTMCRHVST